MSSLTLGKKFQHHNKVSKSFAKFTRAIIKTPRRIADLLGLTLSPSHNQRFPDAPYSSLTSLYDCPCSYHARQREELRRRLANLGGEEIGDAEDVPESCGVAYGDKTESETKSVEEKLELHRLFSSSSHAFVCRV